MEVKDKVKKFLARFIGSKEIGDDDNIFAMGIVNSLFAMQLVIFVEQEFNIAITNEELDIDNFSTINAMCSLIEKKLN